MAEAAGDIFGPINAEVGNLNEFTSTVITAGMTLEASQLAAAVIHGAWGFRAMADGDATSDAYGKKTFTDQVEFYKRFYFQLSDTAISVAQFATQILFGVYDGATLIFEFRLRRAAAGNGVWDNWRIVGPGITSVNASSPAVTYGADHYFEVYYKAGTGADGVVQAWVDGTSLNGAGGETGLALSAYAADSIRIGWQGTSLPNTAAWYFDDIKASTTGPIGAYSETGGSISVLSQYSRRRRS